MDEALTEMLMPFSFLIGMGIKKVSISGKRVACSSLLCYVYLR